LGLGARGRWPPSVHRGPPPRRPAALYAGNQHVYGGGQLDLLEEHAVPPPHPPPGTPEPPALAAALSRAWAWRRKCWFRRPSRRSARIASTWSRLQRHAGLRCRLDSSSDTPDPRARGTPGLGLEALGHQAFLGGCLGFEGCKDRLRREEASLMGTASEAQAEVPET